MFKSYTNSGKLTTTVVLSGNSDDAINYVIKRLGISDENLNLLRLDKLEMQDSYKGTVKCKPDDTFDTAKGIELATKKAMKNRDNAFRKAIIRWQLAMLNKIKSISPDTFNEAYEKFLDK